MTIKIYLRLLTASAAGCSRIIHVMAGKDWNLTT